MTERAEDIHDGVRWLPEDIPDGSLAPEDIPDSGKRCPSKRPMR
jgi:hypothetical protein